MRHWRLQCLVTSSFHSAQHNIVTTFATNHYNMIIATQDNSCNVFNSGNNQTNNAVEVARKFDKMVVAGKPSANICRLPFFKNAILHIANYTFHITHYTFICGNFCNSYNTDFWLFLHANNRSWHLFKLDELNVRFYKFGHWGQSIPWPVNDGLSTFFRQLPL